MKAEFLRLVTERQIISTVAQELGIHRPTAYSWARKAGISTSEARKVVPRRDEFLRLRAQGLTRAEARARVGADNRSATDWDKGITIINRGRDQGKCRDAYPRSGQSTSGDQEMSAEFGSTAAWTETAVRELGQAYAIPPACRGSGGPAGLDWLLDRLPELAESPLLDIGAGMGGPAAYARERRGASVVLVEPEQQACDTARTLFGFELVVASATSLPFPDAAFRNAWCIGVLCTIEDQPRALRELTRVLHRQGRAGMLVYARNGPLEKQPEGNDFPLLAALDDLFADAGLEIVDRINLPELPRPPRDWADAEEAVSDRIARKHGGNRRWRQARDQETIFADLLQRNDVTGQLLTLARRAQHR